MNHGHNLSAYKDFFQMLQYERSNFVFYLHIQEKEEDLFL